MAISNPPNLKAVKASLARLEVDVDAIRAITDSEPILEETGGTITTDGTEQTIYINNGPAGILKPVSMAIDFTAHTAGETVVVRTYYRIFGLGGLIKHTEATFAGAQDPDLLTFDMQDLPNRFGFQITIEKTAGANRAYPWEFYQEVAP